MRAIATLSASSSVSRIFWDDFVSPLFRELPYPLMNQIAQRRDEAHQRGTRRYVKLSGFDKAPKIALAEQGARVRLAARVG
jgi:hypothetical protein